MATAVAPTGDVALCVQSRAISDGHAEDHLRVGFGRPGSVESVHLLDDGEPHEAACIDAAVEGSTIRWLVVRDGQLVLLSSTTDIHGGAPEEELITTGRELAAIGKLDWRTRGRMATRGASRYALVSLGFGPNVLYVDPGTGWKPTWNRWQATQYMTGAPSFLLPAAAGGALPSFVTSLPSPKGVRRPAVYRQTGTPQALYSPPPFAEQAAPVAGRALFARSSPTGETDMVVAATGLDGGVRLAYARLGAGGQWTSSTVFEPLHVSVRGDRAPGASLAYGQEGERFIVFEDNPLLAEAGGGDRTAIRAAILSAGAWHISSIAEEAATNWRFFGPIALTLSSGRPATYFWAQRSGSEPSITLTYRESGAPCSSGSVQ